MKVRSSNGICSGACLVLVLFWLSSISNPLLAQIDFIDNPPSYTNCPTANNICGGTTYLPNAIKFKFNSYSNTDLEFRVRKCDLSNFQQGGTGFLKDGSTCGTLLDDAAYLSGDNSIYLYVPITYWHSGPKNFYATINSNDGYKYWAGVVTVTKTCPDYDITDIALSNQTLTQGENFTINCTINNIGNVSGNPDKVKFYLSTNTTYSANDVFLGQEVMSALPGGQSVVESDNLTIPANTALGNYYIVAVVEQDNISAECDESNNFDFEFVSVVGSPDLLAYQPFTFTPGTVCTDTTINVTHYVGNNGTGTVITDFYVKYYLSTNSTYGTSDVYLGEKFVINNISAGSAIQITKLLTIPGTVNPGNYYIIAYVDKDNAVTESNENNNTLSTTAQLNVTGHPERTYPLHNQTISSLTPTLTWNPVPGVTEYGIGIFDIALNVIHEQNVGNATSYTVPAGILNYYSDYKWVALANLNGQACSYPALWVFHAPCADNYEPNDNFSQPNTTAFIPLSAGSSTQNIAAYLTHADDVDHYRFTANGPGTITLDLTSLPGNYDLELWYPSGPPVISTSVNTGTSNESITFVHTGGVQEFIVKIYSYNHNYDCADTYNLSLDWEPDPNGAFLELNAPMVFSSSPMIVGQTYTFTTNISNYGNTPWTGNFYLKVNNANTSVLVASGVTIQPYQGNSQNNYSLSYAYTPIATHAGNGVPAELFSQVGTNPGEHVSGGLLHDNPVYVDIVNPVPFNLSIASAMVFDPDPLTQNQPSNFSTSIKNTGTNNWTGTVKLKVNGQSQLIGTYTVPSGGVPVAVNYSFTPGIVHVGQNVEAKLQYNTNGNTSDQTVGPGSFQNPVLVDINGVNVNCTSFGDILPSDVELHEAAECLCSLGYINPQDYNNDGIADELNPNDTIYRADLAKVTYLLAYRGNNSPGPAENFAVPFDDLSSSTSSYYRYAKALSYLEYDDGVAPFDRDKINFRPYEGIARKHALKVVLEALDIAPDNNGPSPCTDISPGQDGYGYVKAAYELGWFAQNGAPCNADGKMLRRDVFILLHRILNEGNQSCNPNNPNSLPPVPEANDYFNPGIFTTRNMGRSAGYAEGYFPSYSKTSFSIPGKNLGMSFAHSYNSKLVEIPPEFMPLKPLGEGWTHNYNAYVIETPAWSHGTESQPARIFIFWPNGSIHMYDKATLNCESEGVYDQLTAPNATTYEIKTKNQTRYTFTKYDANKAPGGFIWMLTQIKDRNNNKITVNYTPSGGNPRLNYVIDDSGRKLNFAYHTGTNSDKIYSVQDVAGARIVYFPLYADGNLKSYKNARNYLTTYSYDTGAARSHLLKTITLPEGNVISNVYNTNRKLTETKVGNAAPTVIVPNYNYSTPGTPLTSTVTDGNNTTIQHSFDDNGHLKNLSEGNNSVQIQYNNINDPSLPTSTTYNGYRVDYQYSGNGNVEHVFVDPTGLNLHHQYTYNALNDVVSYKDPKNNVTTLAYDAAHNLDYIDDPMGFRTDFSINAQGLLLSVTSPTNIAYTFDYYATGDLKETSSPLGHKTTMTYDAVGRVKEIKNPNQQVIKVDYTNTDFVDKVTNILSTGNIITDYVYDKNDLLREIENGRGFKTLMTYTNRDLLETVSFGNDTKSFAYRNDNLIDHITKPDGTVFQMTYDALGRVENDGWAAYTYDNQDNILTIEVNGQQNNKITNTYDGINRLKTVSYGGKTITYDYDNNGNVVKITYPGNAVVIDYVYDANNRLTHVKQGSDDLARYFYRNDGLLDSIRLFNGANSKYTYDAAGRMAGMNSKKSTGSIICKYLFALDNNGNHQSENKTEPFGAPAYVSQNVNSAFNGENEINNAGATSFAFDADGNQTQKGATTYTWNNVDQMTGYGNKTFVYDATGLLRQATRNGQVTKYVWDMMGMGNLLLTTDGNDNAQDYYVYGLGLLCRIKAGSGTKHYYHYDFRGSTIAMTDAAQNITHQYQYDAYGAVLQKTEADANPFQFVGQMGVMQETDSLYYMRARWYDASTGRFLSEDPKWNTNLYAYAGGNPVMSIDADGEIANFLITGVAGMAIYSTIQVVSNVINDKEWSEGLAGAAVSGFIGGATLGMGLGAQIAIAGVVGGIASQAANDIQDQKISSTGKYLKSAAISTAFAGLGAVSQGFGVDNLENLFVSAISESGLSDLTVEFLGEKSMCVDYTKIEFNNQSYGEGSMASMPFSPNVYAGQSFMSNPKPINKVQENLKCVNGCIYAR